MNFKANRGWRRSILTAAEVKAELAERARKVATQAGDGHRVDRQVGRTRARASVVTDTPEAMQREATDRNLTRALDAAR